MGRPAPQAGRVQRTRLAIRYALQRGTCGVPPPGEFAQRILGATAKRSRAVYGAPRHDTIGTIVVPDLLFEEVTLRKPLSNSPRPPVLAHPFFEKGG